MKRAFERLYIPLLVISITGHLAVGWVPRNAVMTPWSGGGDMFAYILLARNLVSGCGYTYAGVPSAWRTPGYPLIIAAAMQVFGAHYVAAVRWLQVFLSILAAWLCARATRNFFGELAAKVTLVVGLFFPTLVYFSGELLSECLTAFCVSLFLWIFSRDCVAPRSTTAAAMGSAIGFSALFRPNAAAIGIIAVIGGWFFRRTASGRLQLLLIPVCASLIFSPWIIRNYFTFGHFVLSTKSGTDALCGALNPESRFLPGWEDRMRAMVGHLLPNELETNAPTRLALGSETEIDKRCWRATQKVWRGMSALSLTKWTINKWVTYWFSLDQLLHPGEISIVNRLLHVAAVAFYWSLLCLSCVGWFRLRRARPEVAWILLGYVILMTLVHTPFVMDTRIRSPLLDPLIAVLTGGTWIKYTRQDLNAHLNAMDTK